MLLLSVETSAPENQLKREKSFSTAQTKNSLYFHDDTETLYFYLAHFPINSSCLASVVGRFHSVQLSVLSQQQGCKTHFILLFSKYLGCFRSQTDKDFRTDAPPVGENTNLKMHLEINIKEFILEEKSDHFGPNNGRRENLRLLA